MLISEEEKLKADLTQKNFSSLKTPSSRLSVKNSKKNFSVKLDFIFCGLLISD